MRAWIAQRLSGRARLAGLAVFGFFLAKGLLWLAVPAAAVWWSTGG